jgi:hypothetical protein
LSTHSNVRKKLPPVSHKPGKKVSAGDKELGDIENRNNPLPRIDII